MLGASFGCWLKVLFTLHLMLLQPACFHMNVVVWHASAPAFTENAACGNSCSSVVAAAALSDMRLGCAFVRNMFPADKSFASNGAKRLCMPA